MKTPHSTQIVKEAESESCRRATYPTQSVSTICCSTVRRGAAEVHIGSLALRRKMNDPSMRCIILALSHERAGRRARE